MTGLRDKLTERYDLEFITCTYGLEYIYCLSHLKIHFSMYHALGLIHQIRYSEKIQSLIKSERERERKYGVAAYHSRELQRSNGIGIDLKLPDVVS